MNIEAINQNAEITSTSVCGRHYNLVAISYDEFAFLTELTGIQNPDKGNGDDFVEMDYHSEFIPLIENERNVEKQNKKVIKMDINEFKKYTKNLDAYTVKEIAELTPMTDVELERYQFELDYGTGNLSNWDNVRAFFTLEKQILEYKNALEKIAYHVAVPIGEKEEYEKTTYEIIDIAKRALGY